MNILIKGTRKKLLYFSPQLKALSKVERDTRSVFEWIEEKRDVEKLFAGWMSEYSNHVKRGVHTHTYSWKERNEGKDRRIQGRIKGRVTGLLPRVPYMKLRIFLFFYFFLETPITLTTPLELWYNKKIINVEEMNNIKEHHIIC